MIQKYFNRFEIKYQISLKKRDKIIQDFNGLMVLDPFVRNNHNYEIRSLYFDSIYYNSYFEKADGIKNRKKIRIRYYPNTTTDNKEKNCFIEIKRKSHENVSKARLFVPYNEAIDILDGRSKNAQLFYEKANNQDKNTLNELWYLYRRFNLKPVCVVSYFRKPYIGKYDTNFRLTFDSNIMVRNSNFNLNIGGGTKLIIPHNISIMEIKFSNFIPYWAINILQKNNSIQEKISKFAMSLEKEKTFSII